MRLLVPALFLGLNFVTHTAMAYEEPLYEVIDECDGYEVRAYEPYLVAETVVSGDFLQSGERAFSILADYIFGNNAGTEKMKMTVPVTSQPSSRSGTKMKMTVPVTSMPSSSKQDGQQQYTYQFVMERKYELDELPKPNDSRVALREVPARTVAVLQYSGRRTEQNYNDKLSELLEAIARDEIEVVGKPQAASRKPPLMTVRLRCLFYAEMKS